MAHARWRSNQTTPEAQQTKGTDAPHARLVGHLTRARRTPPRRARVRWLHHKNLLQNFHWRVVGRYHAWDTRHGCIRGGAHRQVVHSVSCSRTLLRVQLGIAHRKARQVPARCQASVERGRFRQGLHSNPQGVALTGSAARRHLPPLAGTCLPSQRWAEPTAPHARTPAHVVRQQGTPLVGVLCTTPRTPARHAPAVGAAPAGRPAYAWRCPWRRFAWRAATQRTHSPLCLFWRLWPVRPWVWPGAPRIPRTYVVVAHGRMAGGGTVVSLAAVFTYDIFTAVPYFLSDILFWCAAIFV